ncbi:MAG: CBS domain-containing protein [Candidatus Kariarchaeaceae archaeon]
MVFPRLREIKRIREKIGWSQIELAQKVGISQSAIPKYESGKQVPSYEIATKIFELLLEEDIQIDPTVSEIMATRVIVVNGKRNFGEVLDLMKEKSISQIPVVRNKTVIGTISETIILDLLDKYHNITTLRDECAEDVMGPALPTVPKNAKMKEITPLLRHFGAIIVTDYGELAGIITKADLLEV